MCGPSKLCDTSNENFRTENVRNIELFLKSRLIILVTKKHAYHPTEIVRQKSRQKEREHTREKSNDERKKHPLSWNKL